MQNPQNTICQFLTPQRRAELARMLAALSLPGELVEPIYRALCGDRRAEEHVRKEVACACKGPRQPDVLTMAAQMMSPSGTAYAHGSRAERSVILEPGPGRVQEWTRDPGFPISHAETFVPQGESGAQELPTPTPTLLPDWNCRLSTGDIAYCQLQQIKSDPYPILSAVPTVFTDDTGLPAHPAGTVYVELVLAGIAASSEICLEGFSLMYAPGGGEPEPLEPLRFVLQGEQVAYDDDGEIIHVWDYPRTTARTGWEITGSRCRCLQPPCVCLPPTARARLVFLVTAAEAAELAESQVEFYRNPNSVGVVSCGPCPPENRCGRAELAPCVCADTASAGT